MHGCKYWKRKQKARAGARYKLFVGPAWKTNGACVDVQKWLWGGHICPFACCTARPTCVVVKYGAVDIQHAVVSQHLDGA